MTMTGNEIFLIAIQAFGGVALFIYGMSMQIGRAHV